MLTDRSLPRSLPRHLLDERYWAAIYGCGPGQHYLMFVREVFFFPGDQVAVHTMLCDWSLEKWKSDPDQAFWGETPDPPQACHLSRHLNCYPRVRWKWI